VIIELFGPPAVGKTTFAHAVRGRLRENGHDAELVLSYRPAEPRSFLDCPGKKIVAHRAAVVRRVLRPVVEIGAMMRHPTAFSNDIRVAGRLVKILPPGDPISSLRYLQYLSRLSHSWRWASAGTNIVLFDQGFVQAVCSLVLRSRTHDQRHIERALELLPKPDLLIRLDAPREVLEARLYDRQRSQSGAERLFELDLSKNLETAEIIDRVHELLRKRGQSVPCFSSLDRHAPEEAAELVEARFGLQHEGYSAQPFESFDDNPSAASTGRAPGRECHDGWR
jgi:thymidylate kinase